MSKEMALLCAVADYVIGHWADKTAIDVNAAALELSNAYPQSVLTIEEIAQKIERCGTLCGATILSGDGRLRLPPEASQTMQSIKPAKAKLPDSKYERRFQGLLWRTHSTPPTPLSSLRHRPRRPATKLSASSQSK